MNKDSLQELVHQMGVGELIFVELEDPNSPVWSVVSEVVLLGILRALSRDDTLTFVEMLENGSKVSEVVSFVREKNAGLAETLNSVVDEEFVMLRESLSQDRDSQDGQETQDSDEKTQELAGSFDEKTQELAGSFSQERLSKAKSRYRKLLAMAMAQGANDVRAAVDTVSVADILGWHPGLSKKISGQVEEDSETDKGMFAAGDKILEVEREIQEIEQKAAEMDVKFDYRLAYRQLLGKTRQREMELKKLVAQEVAMAGYIKGMSGPREIDYSQELDETEEVLDEHLWSNPAEIFRLSKELLSR